MTHARQLAICHERISAAHGDPPSERQYCSLSAYAWCFSCGHYVCDIHLRSRHDEDVHRTQVEYPRNRVGSAR